jgi:hypothetical protein
MKNKLGIDCCNKPEIATLSETKSSIDDGRYVQIPIDNKMCTRCGSHIYGEFGNGNFYTKQEWDRWIDSTFDEDIKMVIV